ncbi:hypothetical protein AAP_03362 [Ascosphaera apis ARSEF 7405]|uniref:DUF1753-domain-containing protein n=1 Tax=Ascosphaera apis ARSEF 7405 TaxID=392613 RepID=A0A167YR21_9EURO|nr:hypothetical protein AAP_03362 [Ascosphaera apis ARSEF 7405]
MFKVNSLSRYFRIPRPTSFLYVLSLQTGASLITLSLLLNKVSGLYGILAILTGYHLSPFQLSMYIYSLLALILTAFLGPYIRTQAPLQCLALAWFYVIDSLINAAYTAAFGATWFLVVSQHHLAAASAGVESSAGISAPGSGMVDDTAGFTNPKYNVSSVAVGTGANGVSASTEGADAPAGMDLSAAGMMPTVSNGIRQPEGLQSILIIVALLTIRVYFSCVMLSFARQCIHQYNSFEYGYAPAPLLSSSRSHSRNSSAASSGSTTGVLPSHHTPSHSRSHSSHSSRHGHHSSHSHRHSRNLSLLSRDEVTDPNPFSPRRPEGQGWKGQLGRAMIIPARSFFLSPDDDDTVNGGSSSIGMTGNGGDVAVASSSSPAPGPSAGSNNVSSSSKGGVQTSVTPVPSNSSSASQRNKLPKLKSKGLPGLSGLGINSTPNSPFNFTFPSITSPSSATPTSFSLNNNNNVSSSDEGGVSERERRRRSGTGPPPPQLIPPINMPPVSEEAVSDESTMAQGIISPVNGRSRTATPLGFGGNRSGTPNSAGPGPGPRGRSTPRTGRSKRSPSHGYSLSTS